MGSSLSNAQPSSVFHPDESSRLEALHRTGLLDSEPDPRLDQITKLAADVFNVPIALFTLVDNSRQWFKARVGMEVCETIREHSFCAHAIVYDDIFEVPDARRDDRFRDNPLVISEPYIRFYAGAQVYSSNRLPLGTLCIIDTVPRTTSPQDRRLLGNLADLITKLIDPTMGPIVVPEKRTDNALLSPGKFLTRINRLLKHEDRENLGLGIVQFQGLRHLRKTRGFEFCERACNEAIKILHRLAPEVVAVTRIGFDRFCLIAKQYSSISGTRLNEQKLENALHNPLTVDGVDVDIQAHLMWTRSLEGISSGQQVMTLIAELSTSSNQFAPKQRLVIYGNELLEDLQRQEIIRSEIAYALENQEVFFEFQPKVDAVSFEIAGFEALMRWRHVELGPVAPNKIVDACFDLGIEQTLFNYTLNSVLGQVSAWRRESLLGGIKISINLCAQDLSSPRFPRFVEQLLVQHDVPGDCIEFELLEDGIIDNLDRCVENIHESKKLGIEFSIDDFGTGFSSLSYLHQIPADTLKIDKSFIDRLESDQTSTALVSAIVMLGRAADMKTVAEGIENQTQAIMMKALQCDYLQGYYFDRPLRTERVTELLREGKNSGNC